ncbi:MAG: RAMP superfamily CRISPR-associated protein [Candidatus Hadarchaeum sp.]|uniref:RAMP superfamily CRISPR-associated protein n=1 Tax=Candidatus Hadarchaeum sp. TaxID=2883567 RepID=UPI003D1241EE
MSGKLVALSPIHIGTGADGGRPTGVDSQVIKIVTENAGEKVYIPGSSLKGVLRSAAENILRARGQGYACDPLNKPDGNCEACSLFGSTERASVVEIKDLIPDGPIQTGVRPGIGIDRNTGSAHARALFTMEFVAPGSVFPFEAVFENPANYQLGLFTAAVEALNRGLVRLGGGKSRGLGEARIDVETLEVRVPFGSARGEKLVQGEKTVVELRGGRLWLSPISDADAELSITGKATLGGDLLYGLARVREPNLDSITEGFTGVFG